MKFPTTLLASLLIMMPTLSVAQSNPAAKTHAKPPDSTDAGLGRDICTTAPRNEWLTQDEMKLLAEHRGYRIKTFKIAKGNCYEIYGFDKEGSIVEAYFNPVTSQLVRQNIAK